MHLNDNIATSLNLPPREGQAFGIELEFENWGGGGPDMRHWAYKEDASLRNNGIEYVSRPLEPAELGIALDEVGEVIEQADIEANNRCGVHVHLNMLPFSWAQLWNLSVTYALLEPTIFEKYAPGRLGSHFCVPTFYNTALYNMMAEDILKLRNAPKDIEVKEIDPIVVPRRPYGDLRRRQNPLRVLGASKYCAMNYARLQDLGTVEFRQAPATMNMLEVQEWVEFLGRLQLYANGYADPLDVLKHYENNGLEQLREDVGLKAMALDPQDQSDAEDAATFMAGYEPPKWNDLEWELPQIAVGG